MKDSSAREAAQDMFLRFEDSSLEHRYREFIQPRTPVTMSIVYIAWTCMAIFGDLFTWQVIGTGYYAGYALLIHIITTFSCAILQLVVHHLEKRKTVSRLTLLSLSDGMLFVMGVLTTMTEIAVMLKEWQQDCRGMAFFIQQPGKVYQRGNCHNLTLAFGTSMGFLMVLRRFRYWIVVAYGAVCLVYNLLIAVLNDQRLHYNVTSTLYINAAFNLFLMVFACAVRYQMEESERRYMLVSIELENQIQAIKSRSVELHAYVCRMVPKAIVERSAHSRVRIGADRTLNGVVCVITTCGAESSMGLLQPWKVISLIDRCFASLTEEAEKANLHRIQTTPDELLFVGNLIDRSSPLTATVAACHIASGAMTMTGKGVRMPLRACISNGPLEGMFMGSSWIQYDVSGVALDHARAGAECANVRQVLLTDESVAIARDLVAVSPGPTLGDDQSPTTVLRGRMPALFLLESVDPPRMRDDSGLSATLTEDQLRSTESSFDDTFRKNSAIMDDSAESNPSSPTAAAKGDALPRYKALQERALRAVEEDDDEQYAMKQVWRIFWVFKDSSIESAFLERRRTTMTHRAVNVWLAYALMQAGLLILLFADFREFRTSKASVILFIVGILLSVALAVYPAVIPTATMAKRHFVWSACGLVVPLISMFAAALARPAAIGNDPSPLAVAAAVVRSPCFLNARYQLIVIPAFLLLSQTQLFLPGGAAHNAVPIVWFLVVYNIITDSENDFTQRENFIAEKKLVVTVGLLQEEKRVREGLVKSALPETVVRAWQASSLPAKPAVSTIPDTMVAVIQRKHYASGSHPHVGIKRFWATVEEAASSARLDIIKMFGDTAILGTPICVSTKKPDGWFVRSGAVEEVIYSLLRLEACGEVSVMADSDTTIQIVGAEPLPLFAFSGVALKRLLALRGIGFGGRGLYITDRVLRVASQKLIDGLLVDPQPPVRIREYGIVRMTKLSVPEVTI